MPNIFRVIGKLIARGDGATDALEVQNSSGTTKLSVADAGRVSLTSDTTVTTQTVSVITTDTTNAGLVLRPNGTGAIMAQAPDGTATGGNARGQYAVDLQMVRNAALCVASGNRSFIGAGTSNSATGSNAAVVAGGDTTFGNSAGGNYAFVGAGHRNSAGGTWAFVGAGDQNSANAPYSVSVGGANNTISSGAGNYISILGGLANNGSGANSAILGGNANSTTAISSTVLGGEYARTSLYSQIARASGRFAANSDAQTSDIRLRREITGTAQTELFLDGASLRAILALPTGATNARAWRAQVDVVAIVATAGGGGLVQNECFMGSYVVGIKRVGATTSLVGAVGVVNEVSDTNMATAVVTIDADDTNEALRIQFTPPSTADGTTVIRVVATAYLTEVGR